AAGPAQTFSGARVPFPAPLGATSPVRPSPMVNDKSVNSGVSSGQEKDRFEQAIDMREISRGVQTGGTPQLARGRTLLRITRRCSLPTCLQPTSSLDAC